MKTIRSKDLLVLSHLRKDARIKLTTLSRATKIPVSTLFDKIKSYQADGVVSKNASLVDFSRLGYQAKALILFSAYKKDREQLGELLNKHRSVNSCFRLNNGWDYSVDAVFTGIKEVEEFLEEIEEKVSLKKKNVHYIIEELKREAFMSTPALVGK